MVDHDVAPAQATGAILAEGGFALYVHWPFCRAKCPYCDFNSHVRDGVDHDRWRAALLRELDRFADETSGRRLDSIFFGGGTPSLMDPRTVAAVIERATGRWRAGEDLEITLEANPTSVEADRFRAFRAAGVNRVSLGVQALHDRDLALLGREHDVATALAAVDLAGAVFPRHSFDLIYARPGQTPERWRDELGEALTYGASHLSLYQLTIEEGTPFAALHASGKLVTPPDTQAAALYEITQELTEASGLPAYEISNHARPGQECRHNLVYWRYGTYAGAGPGAHGRLLTPDGRRIATSTERNPERWRDLVTRQGHGMIEQVPVSAAEQTDEMLLMGLRLAEGIDLDRIAAMAGRPVRVARLQGLLDEGLVTLEGRRLRATPVGRPILNHIVLAVAEAAGRTD